MSPVESLIHIFPDPLTEPPHVGAADGFESTIGRQNQCASDPHV
jgi:hypothetical protein